MKRLMLFDLNIMKFTLWNGLWHGTMPDIFDMKFFLTFSFQDNKWLAKVPRLLVAVIRTEVALVRGHWAKHTRIAHASSSWFQLGPFISSQSMVLFLASSDVLGWCTICLHCGRLEKDHVPKGLFYDFKSIHPPYLSIDELPTQNNEMFIELGTSALQLSCDHKVPVWSNL